MIFGGLQKLTLLDYPGKVACTVFTSGCNFRCPFCHNASLVCHSASSLSCEEVSAFLKKRKNVLEGMCLTGGEPLIQSDVEDFLASVKELGYKVKLDTNGSFPDRLEKIIKNGLVDYVAMDVKNSLEQYPATAGAGINAEAVCRSVELLKSGVVDYEFRTTVTGTFHSESSIESMAKWIAGSKRAFLQKFVDSGDLIDRTVYGCDDETLKRYLEILRRYVPSAEIRGI